MKARFSELSSEYNNLIYITSRNCLLEFAQKTSVICSNIVKVMSYTFKKYCHLLLHLSLGPGISKYAQKVNDIELYLAECMERAKEVVPQSQHQETPVYLGATAGMRLLRYSST